MPRPQNEFTNGSCLLAHVLMWAVLVVGGWWVGATGAWGQTFEDEVYRDRPVAEVVVVGLKAVTETEVRNNLRLAPGMPYDPQTVRDDLNRLYRLGRFKKADAMAAVLDDGSVRVEYVVVEQAQISQVQVVGNKVVSDQELRGVISVQAGGPRDDFLVEQSVRNIKDTYRDKGHYLVEVEIDESQLESSGIMIFRVIEGPRVKIKAVEFEGNNAFEDKQLSSQVKTRKSLFLIRRGQLDEELLVDDIAALDRYYKERGYVDVRVDRTVELSADNREAKVTFLIDEGRQYTVRDIHVRGVSMGEPVELTVFTSEQLAALLELNPGDTYTRDKMRKSEEVILDAYGILGYLDTDVRETATRVGPEPQVDVLITVREGRKSTVGSVRIQGNFLTRDNVIRRQFRLQPGRPFDGRELVDGKERLENTRLFNDVRITVLESDPRLTMTDPLVEGEERDVLIEVKERNTGSFNFGVAAGTDSGLFGDITLRQDNFDVMDTPESFNEFIKGRAFRGAGQKFQISIQPGADVSTYSISLAEPYFLETQNSLRGGSFYRFREYDAYDEERINFNFGVGRRLGDVWTIGVNGRVERVGLDDFDDDAPTEAVAAEGPNWLTGLGVNLVRSTIDRPIRPGRGSRTELGFEQVGAMGGDFEFSVVKAEHTVFLTLDEDFLGRRSILRLNGQVSYIFPEGEAPTYEQFYLGGRSFRGFEFREISPKGIRSDTGEQGDDPVGGEWLVFLGAQYEFPIFEEVVNGVVFVDSGTVTDEVGLDQYRVSAGLGVRLYIRQFGPVPIAFDFGFPLIKEETDEEQLISFSAELPF